MNTKFNHLEVWQELVQSKKTTAALIKHFSFLADTKHFKKILEEIFERATAVHVHDNTLVVTFQDGDSEMVCHAPNVNAFNNHPESMQKIATVHAQLNCGDGLRLGALQTLDFGMYDKDENVYKLFKGKAFNVKEAIWENISNTTTWVFHPTLKNSSGEAALFPIIHELEDEIEPVDVNPGSIFLERMVALNKWKIETPDLRPRTKKNVEAKGKPINTIVWAHGVDGQLYHKENGLISESEFESLFAQITELSIQDFSTLEDIPFDKMPNLILLDVKKGAYQNLTNLNGIEKAKKLESLTVAEHQLTDIEALRNVTSLIKLALSFNQIADISCLTNSTKLQILYVPGNPISNIDVLSHCPDLETLFIYETNIENIDVLYTHKKLEDILVSENFPKEKLAAFSKAQPKVEVDCVD